MNEEQKIKLKIYFKTLPNHLNPIPIVSGIIWLLILFVIADHLAFMNILAEDFGAFEITIGEAVIIVELYIALLLITLLGLFQSLSRKWYFSDDHNAEYQEKVAEALSK